MEESTIFKGVKKTDLSQIISKHLGENGRMIGGSKTLYRMQHPDSRVYFNGCIFDELMTQVWWGDIDITEDKEKLEKIASEYGEPLYITPESFRGDFNNLKREEISKNDLIVRFNERKIKGGKKH